MSAGEKRSRREAAEQAEAVIRGVEALAKTEREVIAALESECSRLADEFPDDPPLVRDPGNDGFGRFEPGVFRRLFDKYGFFGPGSTWFTSPTMTAMGFRITYEVILEPPRVGEPLSADYTAVLRVHAGKR